MKIAIIADTHDNLKNLEKALNWINKAKIQLILHCGDVCNKESVDFISKKFRRPAFDKSSAWQGVKYVKGNGDYDLDLPDSLEIEIDGKRIHFNHYPEQAKRMALSGKYDLVFYGHTHRPWDKLYDKCHMINPGELAGQFYKPTFAVYDTENGKLELKILEQL
jgi:hypothetical protein